MKSQYDLFLENLLDGISMLVIVSDNIDLRSPECSYPLPFTPLPWLVSNFMRMTTCNL